MSSIFSTSFLFYNYLQFKEKQKIFHLRFSAWDERFVVPPKFARKTAPHYGMIKDAGLTALKVDTADRTSGSHHPRLSLERFSCG